MITKREASPLISRTLLLWEPTTPKEDTLALKKAWEKALGNYLQTVRRAGRKGDFNVNPYRDDWSEKAWDHLRHKIGKELPAGCRRIDAETYQANAKAIDCANISTRDPRGREHIL